ncbi:MAG: hypothetical protein ACRDO0_18390 [Nocardioidaceae bacterium]
MSSAELVPSTRVSEADWYGAALVGWGTVESVIPQGFAAYARILHPPSGPAGERARWADVAHWSGTVLHPLAQFSALAGRWEYDQRDGIGWPGDDPLVGCLDLGQLRLLCGILAGHTTTPSACWLTVWAGFGDLPENWSRTAPQVLQPGREYYVFDRALDDVLEFSRQIEDVGWDQDPLPPSMAYLHADVATASAQTPPAPAPREAAEDDVIRSPNQWWPQDHAWCVASEIDFDSTLVAGSQDLVSELVAHSGIESFQVSPGDDLSMNGDRINPLPPGQP